METKVEAFRARTYKLTPKPTIEFCIFPLLRTALGAAFYAFLITKDTDLANMWTN